MKEILTPELVQILITAVLVPILVKAINLGSKALENKINNDRFNKYVFSAEKSVEAAVVSTGQTFVDAIKKNGEWNQAAKEEAFYQAKKTVLTTLGAAAKQELAMLYGDLDQWINTRIEYYVKKNKVSG